MIQHAFSMLPYQRSLVIVPKLAVERIDGAVAATAEVVRIPQASQEGNGLHGMRCLIIDYAASLTVSQTIDTSYGERYPILPLCKSSRPSPAGSTRCNLLDNLEVLCGQTIARIILEDKLASRRSHRIALCLGLS